MMCTTCGCKETSEHDHDHDHGHNGDVINFGGDMAGVHVPGLSQRRIVSIEKDILSRNNKYAAANRALLARKAVFSLNFMSGPGSGKTTILIRIIEALAGGCPVTVIEGDQQTSNDAERIRATGVQAIQLNTGKGCHLDAHMVGHALEKLSLAKRSLLFIENVGNLVCPAAFDLGEARKITILSATDGEDKPLKYPDMFAVSNLMLLNKADLLPHLEFDKDICLSNAIMVNPLLQTMVVSAKTGEGINGLIDWIKVHATAFWQSSA